MQNEGISLFVLNFLFTFSLFSHTDTLSTRRFLESPTFLNWYHLKKRKAIVELRRRYTEVVATCDLAEILKDRSEMVCRSHLFIFWFSFSLQKDVVECYIQIGNILKSDRRIITPITFDRLKRQHVFLTQLLSPDLRILMKEKVREREREDVVNGNRY